MGKVKVINNGLKEKRVDIELLEVYLNEGWKLGQLESHKKANSKKHKGKATTAGRKLSDEQKKKISDSLKGHTPWNKGLTIEDPRVANNIKNVTQAKIEKYSSAFKNNNMNDEHKQKISQALKGRAKGKMDPEKLKIKLQKEYITKKKNKSLNSSSPENKLYEELLKENESKTIYRNYKDDIRYPYYCDFYIVEDDLFIELNAHWTHGGMPFDPNNQKCIEQLDAWKIKAKDSQFYANAIQTWTIRDVEKAACAKKNNLNYKVIY